MAEPSTVIPLSSDDNTFHTVIESLTLQNLSSLKKMRGRPVGAKNKPKLPFVIHQNSKHVQKPILIQVPKNTDVIDTVVQFALRYQVRITVLSASGPILNATLRHTTDNSTFILYGPFNLVSLTGTYINNNFSVACSSLSTSSTNLDLHHSFSISFCSISGQSFSGIIGGKVIAADDVNVVANVFNNLGNYKAGISGGGGEKDKNNLDACDPSGNENMSMFT
ncbi:hypothetical protein VNO78_33653 [Psophocarpus tetragonolobus]|uniref:PPC domain-containing protein n=1 Tax=Psophocarpus tetragonolobus TaxID=3891 RepID=A0AAN9P1J3_PSOTE